MKRPRVVVIGAGIGGLSAAALLLRAGFPVTVLEAQVYPGGSAGTFFHKGFRFDAGATLAGGFAPGGPHARLGRLLGVEWPVRPVDPAWVTHLPNRSVTQWAGRERWREERRAAFPGSEPFWRLQEHLAEAAWQVSARPFPWPPVAPSDWLALLTALSPRAVSAAPWALSSVAAMLPHRASHDLRLFLDANLIIAAQTTSQEANALYGSAALDLPRRGVNHVRGGIGALAETLVEWIRANGGQVLYRHPVGEILVKQGCVRAVRTRKGAEFPADVLLANLTPWSLAALLGKDAPPALRHETASRPPTWGAFTLYLGLDASRLPGGLGDHHQVIVDPSLPLGEGNSVFLSLNDPGDPRRAPDGMRALTLSTHTAVRPWWELLERDPQAYAARKEEYTRRCLDAAERAIPGLRGALRLCLPGTPVTFQFYTGRSLGMVGGFPQTSLLRARGPRTGLPNLFLVGDSVFPGQSTAGVTVGAMRVAAEVEASTKRPVYFVQSLYKELLRDGEKHKIELE